MPADPGDQFGLEDVVRSLSALEQFEQALREVEGRYWRLFEATPDGVTVADSDTLAFLHANPAFQRLSGYEEHELLQMSYTDLGLPGETLDQIRAFARESTPEGDLAVEAPFMRRDGSVLYADIRLVMEVFEGRPVLLGFVRDVTERRRALNELRESQIRYRAVVEDMIAPVCRYRSDGTLTFVNNAYWRCYGRSADSILGTQFMPAMPEEDRERLARQIASLGPDEPVGTVKLRVTVADGSLRWQEWTNRAILDDAGGILEYQSVAHDITEQMLTEEELRRLSATDPLTGLANRRTFDAQAAIEWKRHQRESEPLSVIWVDIDRFKQYNDGYGHQAGDQCLRQVAAIIRSCISRAGDLPARYGGEEFLVLLPDTDCSGAVHVADRMRAAVEKAGIPHARSDVAPVVTISLGVASCVPDASGSIARLITAGDEALYRAKAGGRNRVVLADFVESDLGAELEA